jgi:multimeric flavodoxin WrbA
MDMKIAAVVGSPRGVKGATGTLAKLVLEGAEAAGAAIEIFAVKGQEVKPCKACDTCHRVGACAQKDAFATIKAAVDGADAIVLATPNYISHVSAQLKAFIDRCCGAVHLQSFEGKYGAAVVTSGGGDEAPIADYMNRFLAACGAVPVGSVWATMGQIQGYDFPPDTREKALALGRRLVEAFEAGESSPDYAWLTLQFKERMRSLMNWRKDEWPYEYEYWKAHKGL